MTSKATSKLQYWESEFDKLELDYDNAKNKEKFMEENRERIDGLYDLRLIIGCENLFGK